ncbi:adenosylmethionine--8-amino-7-oxononanoate transaminase [Sandaracinomonas limnophila]|uniref:Adenosylmethionine-8-amino-7-oxononanoate aminotransferase n=1 Tax=Sandaracinomonas limnophila TaxID=1862386 RepID=A0A437PTW5_9BACT|nr:adenosylmethionine--8-amino-7-oxononanoate transaminase [Sandaracinomonas limnophila]RVU25701.1 adenosylmethionine--8-amino-7-oxononanoate transaminase [Sandaracinomonas limnophila]
MQNLSFGPLSQRDQKVIWHPFTQHQIEPQSIAIQSGKGALLFDENGNEIIDAISSWWVSIHGHGNEYLAQKIYEQAIQLEQVIFAGFTHPQAIKLSERLLKKLPNTAEKLFFSDNGSTAVEVAIKMALQYFFNIGQPEKRKILAFEDAYHGDTFGAMSLGAPSSFNAPFQDMLFEVDFLPSPTEPEKCLEVFKEKMNNADNYAAFIFEPLIQGAGGMKMYSPDLLNDLIQLSKSKQIFTIADEIMTGFGRTGKFFAIDYLNQKPDIICMSKGLTGGMMAMGITSCSNQVFEAFLSNDRSKTLFHSHSFTGNPLACAAANASLDLFENENIFEKIEKINHSHQNWKNKIQQNQNFKNIRILGTIIALELTTNEKSGYLNSKRDLIYTHCLQNGVLLRPLGNTIYILPPFVIQQKELNKIYQVIEEIPMN